jgi:DNA-binding XRE family transcriptional regulator
MVLHGQGETQEAIAETVGVAQKTVSNVIERARVC